MGKSSFALLLKKMVNEIIGMGKEGAGRYRKRKKIEASRNGMKGQGNGQEEAGRYRKRQKIEASRNGMKEQGKGEGGGRQVQEKTENRSWQEWDEGTRKWAGGGGRQVQEKTENRR